MLRAYRLEEKSAFELLIIHQSNIMNQTFDEILYAINRSHFFKKMVCNDAVGCFDKIQPI